MERKTILIVEDSDVMRSFLVASLEGLPYDVVEAPTGFEALKILPHHPLAMIVTDINMPDINGLELISFLRANPNYRRVPVLIISTENSAEDRKRGLELGAAGYLVKPFGAEALRAAVDAALAGRPPEGGA